MATATSRVTPTPAASRRRPDRVLAATSAVALVLVVCAGAQWTLRPDPAPVDLRPLQDAASLAARQDLGVRVLGASVASIDDVDARVLVLADGEGAPGGQVLVDLRRDGARWVPEAVTAP